jgi:hypothetical protein
MTATDVSPTERTRARTSHTVAWMPGTQSGDQHLYAHVGRRFVSLCGWYVRAVSKLEHEAHGPGRCTECARWDLVRRRELAHARGR